MAKIHICVDLTEEAIRAYECEARRQGVTLQLLIERMVNGLIRDMEGEEEEGTDHPVIAS